MSTNTNSALAECREAPSDYANLVGGALEAFRTLGSLEIVIEGFRVMIKNPNSLLCQGSPSSKTSDIQGCEALISLNRPKVDRFLNSLDEHCKDLGKLLLILEQSGRKLEVHLVDIVKPEALTGSTPLTAMPSTYVNDCTVCVIAVEAFRCDLYLLCFSKHISDAINPNFSNFRCNESKKLYEVLSIDIFVIAGLYDETNYALRWFIMAALYNLFDRYVFRSSSYNQPEAHKTTTEILFNFLLPFLRVKKGLRNMLRLDEKSKFKDFRKLLSGLVYAATQLRLRLDNENTNHYSMAKLLLNDSNRDMAILRDSVHVVHVLGAAHSDDSRDVAWLMVFGQLTRKSQNGSDDCVVCETKPWVVVYRPEKDEELPKEPPAAEDA